MLLQYGQNHAEKDVITLISWKYGITYAHPWLGNLLYTGPVKKV